MENLKATDSLKLIQSVIELRKRKHESNGLMLLFWGALVSIAGIVQFAMIKMGKGSLSGWAWIFTMIPGFIFTFISAFLSAKKQAKNNQTPDSFGWVWAFAGVLAMLNGFVFGKHFGIGFTASIFIPFCIVGFMSAISIKNMLWIIMSVLGVAISYFTLFLPFIYHPLCSALLALIMFVIPGISLYVNYKKNTNV